jgi:glutamate/tyrosine decarboxylase-like PLP-dependent enzyme
MRTQTEQSQCAIQVASDRAQSYLAELYGRAVSPSPDAVAALEGFRTSLPDHPSDPVGTIDLLHSLGSPATTATAGGRFFGLVVGGSVPAALGARVLSSAWDQVVFNDSTSPVGIVLEEVAASWLLDLLDLPPTCSVGFVTGATMANVTCLAAARHEILRRQGWDARTQGIRNCPPFRIVAGEETHITVFKALALLGLGTDSVERVPCDDQGRIRVDQLPQLDANMIVLAQAGNVNSGASDDIAGIVERGNGAWVHVDGAFGLWAAASPTLQGQLFGYEAADSWVVDGHKWLNTPYDCGMAICRHAEAVHTTMATQAPYLKAGGTAAPKDMVPEFSRSARGVEVWAALHSLGRSGIADMLDRTCAHARRLAKGLQALGFVILNEVVLNQVVATVDGAENRMAELAARVQASGEAWFGPTHWRGRSAVRFSVASWMTDKDDIERTLDAVAEAKRALFGV